MTKNEKYIIVLFHILALAGLMFVGDVQYLQNHPQHPFSWVLTSMQEIILACAFIWARWGDRM